MAYNSTGLVVHDADAHIMEPPNWLRDHADAGLRDRIEPLRYPSGNELRQTGDPDHQLSDLDTTFDRLRQRHASTEYRDAEATEIMNRKNFAATGSFLAEDRPRALDLLGFASQLVFNTFHNRRLRDWRQRPSTWGRPRSSWPRAVPHTIPPATSASTRCGRRRARRASRWCSMSAAPAT